MLGVQFTSREGKGFAFVFIVLILIRIRTCFHPDRLMWQMQRKRSIGKPIHE